MKSGYRFSVVLAALASCGGRSALDQPPAPECAPGDPPVTLLTTNPTAFDPHRRVFGELFALTNDGHRVFVAQTPSLDSTSTLWSIDGYGKDHVDISTAPVLSDIFASAGGVIFSSGQEIEWATSSASRVVAPIASTPFLSASDPSQQYVFAISNMTVERIAVATGVVTTFTHVDGPDYIMSLAVTAAFVHVVIASADDSVTDRRFGFDGVPRDSVALGHVTPSFPPVGGGSNVCAYRESALVCLPDQATQPVIVTTNLSARNIVLVDDAWVYVNLDDDSLARLALDGSQLQTMFSSNAAALTTFGTCVYGAVWASDSTQSIVRLARF